MANENEELARLLERTKEGGETLQKAQERARPACIAAVRKLESALVDALGGDKLKGLPLLDADETGKKFFGARARGKTIEGQLKDAPILIVSEDGSLHMASAKDHMGYRLWTSLPADDSELLVEDVEHVTKAVSEVLLRHLAVVAQRTARFERMAELAKKLESALG